MAMHIVLHMKPIVRSFWQTNIYGKRYDLR